MLEFSDMGNAPTSQQPDPQRRGIHRQLHVLHEELQMTDDLDAPDALDREKALALAAVAATAWCARGGNGAQPGRLVVEQIMGAASWVSRARRHHSLPAVGLVDLVAAFSEPVGTWLPGGGSFVLVEDGQLTPICKLRQVGLDLAGVYQRVPVSAVTRMDGREVFFPCPRCGWPMHVQGSAVSCYRSPTCLAAGARFDLRDGSLVGLSKLPPPSPVSPEGMAALRPGVWRFTVLPGLEELALERRLREIEDVEVHLWPFVDAYDLDVRRGPLHWRIDVKDHSSVTSLARHLNEHPVREPTWIVVPEARREQVPRLQRLVDPDTQYFFADAREIVRRVKGAA